jgi:hypothetical protein
LSHKKTIKDRSTLRLRAKLLFLQEVNSTFETGGEGSIKRFSGPERKTSPEIIIVGESLNG